LSQRRSALLLLPRFQKQSPHLSSAHLAAPQPRIAVIIPTYNQFEYAKIAVESCLKNTANCLVILVDDGSPEWTPSMWTMFPPHKLITHRFPKNDKNLTRSWNKGVQLALANKCQVIVTGNSDLKFPPMWSKGIVEAIAEGVGAVGPTTNAPGHRAKQNVKHYCRNYRVDDSDEYLKAVSSEIILNHSGKIDHSLLNGFCMAASSSTWLAGAYNSSGAFYNPKFKMVKNEDDLIGRWRKLGFTTAVACSSFVFHYRGVTRHSNIKRAGKGALRIDP
jgi:GT2 family glycosyltransferase